MHVSINGTTLLLAPVEHVDAGLYQCSLVAEAASEKVVHTVEVFISPELESRNWNNFKNSASSSQFEAFCFAAQRLLFILLL